tara:strand:+ start:824 stop:1609 length:786 start_codon:yes stop_codon:yes gene_type:complete
MVEIPESHPRKSSLIARQGIVEASSKGLLAGSAMIAHGRGEAFDYLLGERTTESARSAIREASYRLSSSEKPVISVNGNTVVLAGRRLLRLAAVLGCAIEVNLYYRTRERISGLLSELELLRDLVSMEDPPDGFVGDWSSSVKKIRLLGKNPDFEIAGLEGPRSKCTKEGIGCADTILVPLEDGDRCEALIASGKEVIVVDLNPLSRSSRNASITIVDEVSRASEVMLEELLSPVERSPEWDNSKILKDAIREMCSSMTRV